LNWASRNVRFLILILSVAVLPILVISAFSSSLAVVPTYPQIVQNTYNIPYFNTTAYELYYNQTTGQPQPIALFPSIPSSYITFFVIALFLVAASILLYNIRISFRKNLRFSELSVEEIEAQRSEIANALDLAIYRLREGGEYRKTVLECYRQISQILERKSGIEGHTLTAREFKKIASEKLGLHSTSYLDQATNLFEVARYSENEISEGEARKAIECLENLGNELKDRATTSQQE